MEALKQKNIKIFTVTLARRVVFALILILIFDLLLFAVPVLAAEYSEDEIIPVLLNTELPEETGEIRNNLPENDRHRAISASYHTVTAYNSEVAQCDATPCITANGFNVCEHGIEDTVAANWLPFGTKIRIPEMFGDRVFYVRDRMNKRFSNRVDIWMLDKGEAIQFGIRVLKIEVLEH